MVAFKVCMRGGLLVCEGFAAGGMVDMTISGRRRREQTMVKREYGRYEVNWAEASSSFIFFRGVRRVDMSLDFDDLSNLLNRESTEYISEQFALTGWVVHDDRHS
jgi:hypothetical protein